MTVMRGGWAPGVETSVPGAGRGADRVLVRRGHDAGGPLQRDAEKVAALQEASWVSSGPPNAWAEGKSGGMGEECESARVRECVDCRSGFGSLRRHPLSWGSMGGVA